MMSEEDKYYTPELKEFHVGFEYEVRHENRGSYNSWTVKILDNLCMVLNSEKVEFRVKHLDREDIESLGFIARREQFGDTRLYRLDLVKPLFLHHPELDTLYFAHYRHDARCILFLQKIKRVGIDEERPETQLFNGYIKNKSELKRLLKQIGV